MSIILIIAAVFIVAILWYAIVGRAWLKKQHWADGFFASIEAVEIALFQKSETILIGRLVWAGGLLVTLHDGLAVFVSSLDLTPVTTRAFDYVHIPVDLRGVVTTALVTVLGYLINWLRKRTTKPLEVVAVASKDVTPEVAQALVSAEVSKDEAVAAVKAV